MKEILLVVDDEAEIREMLKNIFTLENYLVYTAKDGKEALMKVAELGKNADQPLVNENSPGPDLILLDVNMPEMNGYEVCERIREYVSCPILFLTAKIEEEDKVKGFRTGGDDYIEKPFSVIELRERVAAHLRRQKRTASSEAVAFHGGFTISYSTRQVLFGTETVSFTKTEYDIVEFLSRNQNQVFTKEMIYEHLWEFDKDGESSIITEHIRRIRTKLKKYTEEIMIETVWGVGYRWIG